MFSLLMKVVTILARRKEREIVFKRQFFLAKFQELVNRLSRLISSKNSFTRLFLYFSTLFLPTCILELLIVKVI